MKKRYEIKITETLERVLIIEAESEYEAVELVEDKYSDCELILTSEDFVGYSIECNSEVVDNV